MSEMDAHVRFEELAAGYALGALEPEDDAVFRAHLDQCDDCTQATAEFGDVAGGLATLAVSEEPPPDLWANIRAAVRTDTPSPDTAPVLVITPRPPRRFPVRPLALAAASVALLGAGGWLIATQVTGDSGQTAEEAIAACRQSTTCTSIALHSSTTAQPAAVALVRGQRVQIAATGLAAIDAHDHTYVLWQISRGGHPAGVMTFAVTTDRRSIVATGELPAPYADTTRFAISLENGTSIPSAPSTTIATGSTA